MKKIKYIVLILLILLSSVILYLFMPLSLEVRYGFKDEIPHEIIVIKAGVDYNGMPMSHSVNIADKDSIADIYNSLKNLELSKSFRNSKHLNQYVVNIVNYDDKKGTIKTVSLTETDYLVNIKGTDYKSVNSQKAMDKIIDIFEKKFNSEKKDSQF